MAADEQAAVVSGADIGEGLRRRYVPSQTAAALNTQREADDKKKQAKQVRITSHDTHMHTAGFALIPIVSAAFHTPDPPGVGVGHRSHPIYRPLLLHSSLQDWHIGHRHMG